MLAILPTLHKAKNLLMLVQKLLAHDGYHLLIIDDRFHGLTLKTRVYSLFYKKRKRSLI